MTQPRSQAASAYRQASFDNAPPLKLVRLLYQGAMRFLDEAQAFDPETQPVPRSQRLLRADAIVSELRCALEHDVAPELCGQLDRLYAFVEAEIRRAIDERTNDPLASAYRILATLLDGWKQVEVQSEQLV